MKNRVKRTTVKTQPQPEVTPATAPATNGNGCTALEKIASVIVPPPKKDDVLKATALAMAEEERKTYDVQLKKYRELEVQKHAAYHKTEDAFLAVKEAFKKAHPDFNVSSYSTNYGYWSITIEVPQDSDGMKAAVEEFEKAKEALSAAAPKPLRTPEQIYHQLKLAAQRGPVDAILSDPAIKARLKEWGTSVLSKASEAEKIGALTA